MSVKINTSYIIFSQKVYTRGYLWHSFNYISLFVLFYIINIFQNLAREVLAACWIHLLRYFRYAPSAKRPLLCTQYNMACSITICHSQIISLFVNWSAFGSSHTQHRQFNGIKGECSFLFNWTQIFGKYHWWRRRTIQLTDSDNHA